MNMAFEWNHVPPKTYIIPNRISIKCDPVFKLKYCMHTGISVPCYISMLHLRLEKLAENRKIVKIVRINFWVVIVEQKVHYYI